MLRRSRVVWILRLALVAVVAGMIGPHVWAWTRFRAARAAVERLQPDAAQRELAACRKVWGWESRAAVHLLAARASRQDDDFETATRELRMAQEQLGGATDETAFEWALIQASAGNIPEVEEFLQRRLEQSPEVAPAIWESLIQGYLRVYRTLDAMSCANAWLKLEPDHPRALDLRGQTYITGKGVVRGVEDYRRVLELDPTRRKTRWRMIISLMDLGSYPEAAENLEIWMRQDPHDPKAVAFLARCYNFIGRRAEARDLLKNGLERNPNDGDLLRTRGQIALMDDQKTEAERYLRQAAEVMPQDYQTQWLLFETLRQQGKLEEAKIQNAKAEQVKAQATRLSDLQSRKLAEFPFDPALHYEMGAILCHTGRSEVGVQWFKTALSLDPDHQPSHAALARYYQEQGEAALAQYHREKAQGAR